jgi:transcriptional regulator of acetoin/glycerol metabolism
MSNPTSAEPGRTRPGTDRAGRSSTQGPAATPLSNTVEQAKRRAVVRVLKRANGDVSRAAAELGVLRTSLYRIMKRYGIATRRATNRPAE